LPSTFKMPTTHNTLQNTATYDLANTYFATNLPHDCHPVGALGMPEGTMKLVLCRYQHCACTQRAIWISRLLKIIRLLCKRVL